LIDFFVSKLKKYNYYCLKLNENGFWIGFKKKFNNEFKLTKIGIWQ
jgi:hypothetical protein